MRTYNQIVHKFFQHGCGKKNEKKNRDRPRKHFQSHHNYIFLRRSALPATFCGLMYINLISEKHDMASAQYQGTGHTKQVQKFRVRTSIKFVRQCFLNAGFLKHAKVVPDHTGSEVTKLKSEVRDG